MKKILFPTDFSLASNNAFIYALKMAARLDAKITTLHAYQRPDLSAVHLPNTLREVYDSIDLETFESYRDAIPVLHQIAEEAGLDHLEWDNLMIEGDTLKTILGVAQKEEVDFIIMGSWGASGIREVLKGSLAGEIMEHAACPVLMVPDEAVFDGKIDHIAFTTTFSEVEEKALIWLAQLADSFSATLHCLNVDTANVEFHLKRMETLKAKFNDYSHIKFISLSGNDIEAELIEYMEAHQIDFLGMLMKKRNFWQELFNYSHTKKMAYHSHRPVLSIREEMVG